MGKSAAEQLCMDNISTDLDENPNLKTIDDLKVYRNLKLADDLPEPFAQRQVRMKRATMEDNKTII